MSLHRGPELPYIVVAGVTPWGRQWLVGSAKLHTVNFAPEAPQVFATFLEVLSQYPTYAAIVVNAPIGYVKDFDAPARFCDVEARKLLGKRAAALSYAPPRSVMNDTGTGPYPHLGAVGSMLLPRYREVAAEMSPFRQRTVYQGHPELSFFQLNDDTPLRWSKQREEGREERRALLEKRIPGIRAIIDSPIRNVPQKHLLDVAALAWTARRVMSRGARRVPPDAQWDDEGLRMEYVY